MRAAHAGLVVALLAAPLSACHVASPAVVDAQVASDDVVSGSRLKAQWVGGPEGPVAPTPWAAAFHDVVLGEPCDFALATDGVLRCLGGYRRGAVFARSPRPSRYADPGCTDVIVDRTPGCQAPSRWLAGAEATACPPTVRVRKPGAKLEPGAPVYERTGAGCVPSTTTAGAEEWTLVDEDPAIFAAASYQDGPSAGGFTVQRIVSEDGAHQAIGLRPEGERWVGVPALAADGSWRLFPSSPTLSSSGGFSDLACTETAMTGSGCPLPGELGVAWTAIDGCRSGAVAYVMGPRLEQQYFGAACTASPTGAAPVFSVTERPEWSLPEATRVAATARLQQATFEVGARWRWRQGMVIDAVLGEEVRPDATEDGVRRWLPTTALWFEPIQGAAATWAFSDAACTERLLSYPATGCLPPGRWAEARAPVSCGSAVLVWSTEPWSGPELHTRAGPDGPCVPSPPDAALRYVRLVRPAAPETFAPASELLR